MTKPACLTAIVTAAVLAVSPINVHTAVADEPVCDDEAVKAGKKQFRKCRSCHKMGDGEKSIGPHLYKIVGRKAADVEGFKYSKAMKKFGVTNVWDVATLDAFLEKPKKFIKGTRMSFGGIKKESRRADLICYLKKAGGS